MNDLRQYSKKFIVEFIEMYKTHPTLWQMSNKDYRDKGKKAAAYKLLVNKCREVEPDCDKDTVVKKINSLRTCYRKEFKKVRSSLRRGEVEVYKPKLWYYDLLTFLNEDPVLSDDSSYSYADEDVTSDCPGTQIDPLTSHSESMSESARSTPSFSMFVPAETTKRPQREERERITSFAAHKSEDEFDLLGKIYASKLRKLGRDQKLYAEKIINDTLFEAELGNLNRQCKLVTAVEKQLLTDEEIDLKSECLELC